MKTIDANSYLNALCELTDKGKKVSTVVTGGSMSPFLASNRDFVCLEKPKRTLRKGDVVLFKRLNGDFVLHRIRYIRDDGYYLIGDRQTAVEGPITRDRILAQVTEVKRKNKWITPKNFTWKFFKNIWPHTIFLRPAIFFVLSVFRRKGKQESS